MPLQGGSESNGAVFLLRNGPIQDVEVELDGWTVRVTSDVNAVVAYGNSGPRTFSEGYDVALTSTNNALDYMSARGLCDVQIRDAHDDCLVWWSDIDGVAFRANVIWTHLLHSSAKVVALDADGNVVPQILPTAMKHDAFRFIRMSRTSEYLFDSYRNMFLAFESVLSDLRPRRTKPNGKLEGEGDWFKAALREADKLVPVASLAPEGVPSAVNWVYASIYSDARSGLMHAKQGQPYHLPQDDQSRHQLQKSLKGLWIYLSQLMDKHLGIAHMSSGFMQDGFQIIAKSILSAMIPAVTADATPIALHEELFAPTGARVIGLQPGSVVATEPFLAALLASCDTTELVDLPTIGRIGSTDTMGNLLALSSLLGPIKVGSSVKRLEIMLGIRGVNAAGPRTHFSA